MNKIMKHALRVNTHTKNVILHRYLAKFKLFLRHQRANLKNKIKHGDREEKCRTNWSHSRERIHGRVREFPQKHIPTEIRIWNSTNPSIIRSHQFQTPKNKHNSIIPNITSNFQNFHTSNKVSGNFPLGSKLKRELKRSRGILVLPSPLKTGGIGLKTVAYNGVVSL